jgi:hypothetical protein
MDDLGSLITDNKYNGIILRLGPEETARTMLEKLRWPKGACCPSCGSQTPIYKQSRRGVPGYYRCPATHVRPHSDGVGRPLVFTVRTGTALERSNMPLAKWVYCLTVGAAAHQNTPLPALEVPAARLAGLIKVNRKTAVRILRLLHELRFGTHQNDGLSNAFLHAFMHRASDQLEELVKARASRMVTYLNR